MNLVFTSNHIEKMNSRLLVFMAYALLYTQGRCSAQSTHVQPGVQTESNNGYTTVSIVCAAGIVLVVGGLFLYTYRQAKQRPKGPQATGILEAGDYGEPVP